MFATLKSGCKEFLLLSQFGPCDQIAEAGITCLVEETPCFWVCLNLPITSIITLPHSITPLSKP